MHRKSAVSIHLFGHNNSIVKELLARRTFATTTKYTYEKVNEAILEKRLTLHLQENTKNVFLYTWGQLLPKRITDQTMDEAVEGFKRNFMVPATILESLNTDNREFLFIYLSSESATKGSYDLNYAAQKCAMNLIIKELQPANKNSNIIGIAPSMIEDAGMTLRRTDSNNVQRARSEHPKKRLAKTEEIVSLIDYLIDEGTYISNTIIEVNGGKFARVKTIR
jgi:NAD(P)-dependent dehydrogenase (short-subunit alcohol dehydrogenase family)